MKTALLASLLLASCAAPAAPVSAADASRDREAILAADREFDQAAARDGVPAAFHAYLTDDAWVLSNGEAVAHGRVETDRSYADFPKGTLHWAPEHAEAAASGDLGWSWGHYVFEAPGKDGAPVKHYGKYLTVWRKENGRWRVAADTGNSDPPPANK